jgi:hypothetical protein
MKFIAKSMLILLVLAVTIGGVTYNVLSANVKQSGTINLAPQNLAKETRAVTDEIDQVDMNGPFDLVVVQAKNASLVIEGEERLLPKVVVQQDGKILRISTKGMLVTMNQTVRVTLAIPKLTAVSQSGSGDSEVRGFSGADIKFNLNGSGEMFFAGQYQHVDVQSKGSGDFELEVTSADRVEVSSYGSGDVVISGKAKEFSAVSTASGNIDAERLITQKTDAISHGAGNIKFYANKDASVISTGPGDVEIYGNPGKKTISNTGSGEISFN